MDMQTLFLRAMAQAIDNAFKGGPHPTDDVLIEIEPRLACLLDVSPDEQDEDEDECHY